MKRSLTAIIGIVLMLAMTLALVGCNKKTDETATVTAAAPTVVSQQVEQPTQAQQNAQEQQNAQQTSRKATQKAIQKATQKATKKATQKATKKATQKATEAAGSPVQRHSGRYGNGRCTIDVIAVSNNTVKVHVTWSSSAWEHSEWTMSGNFDEDGNYLYYNDCTKKDYKFNDDGETETVETVYVGGHGAFRFNGNKMTWTDDIEHIADGMTFTK